MKYTKENINGVVFTSSNMKYRVVYPGGTKNAECDLFHYSDSTTKYWDTIERFNHYVNNKQFKIVEEPQIEPYPIF